MRVHQAALLGFLLCQGLATAGDDAFVQAMAEARTAFESQSFERMADAAARAEGERPGHPDALFSLAVARALGGNPELAIPPLQRLADMGLARDIEQDARLQSLKGLDGYAALTRRLADNAEPVGEAVRLLTHDERRFFPVGIAYDRDTNDYFLSSLYRREVVIPGEQSGRTAFVPAGAHGIHAALGLHAESNRRLLWITSAALPQMRGYDDSLAGLSMIVAVDLDTGRVSRRFEPPEDAGPHLLSHITVGRRGELFVSDALGGRVYAVNRISGAFDALGGVGQFSAPHGLAQSRDRRHLYIADFDRGLFVHDRASGAVSPVSVPEDVCVYGLDGLTWFEGDLLGVQRGVQPQRIVRLHLADGGRAVEHLEVLAAADPDFDGPTQGVVNGRGYYVIANGQQHRLGDDSNVPRASNLKRPTIVRIRLD